LTISVSGLSPESDGDFFDVSANVRCDGRDRRMTFRRYGNHPSLRLRTDTYDPFAAALIMPAMMRGERLEIEGAVDDVLLVSLRGPIQETLRLLQPRWAKVPVNAEPRPSVDVANLTLGAATAMSGGVDSMHMIRQRFLKADVPQALRVQTLLHHHVGAHGDDAEFQEQRTHCQRIADRLGLPLVGTICPMGDLYQEKPFVQNAAVRNVAAAMALDHLFSSCHYASSEPIGGRPSIGRLSGIASIEPILLPYFNTPRVSWHLFGGATTRLQKTAEVISDEATCRDVLVCIRGSRRDRRALNCGRCYKCARLLLQAEVTGRLDVVSGLFDMDEFRAGRNHAIGRLLRFALGPSRNPVDADLIVFLVQQKFAFPWWARPWVELVLLSYGRQHSLEDPGYAVSV
jgi:hypothetical protein